jgi:hypothetical protein
VGDMDSYVVAFVIAGLVICLCAPLFGRLAQGIMGAMDVSSRTGRVVSSVFRVGIFAFGTFCILVGLIALFWGARLVPAYG